MTDSAALDALTETIRQRLASGDPDSSYVARLHGKGLDAILKKVGEEAAEVLIAALPEVDVIEPEVMVPITFD